MRNPSSRSFSVWLLATALLVGAPLVVTRAATPAADSRSRPEVAHPGAAADSLPRPEVAHPGVAADSLPSAEATQPGAVADDDARPPGSVRRAVRPQPSVALHAQSPRPVRAGRAARSAASARPRANRAARAARPPIPLSDGVWARLRRCESGGRYDINTGNGFYGAYQFLPSTWRGLGYSGMPHHAPPHVQDEAAQKLQARSGWGQWPACSRKLGLR